MEPSRTGDLTVRDALGIEGAGVSVHHIQDLRASAEPEGPARPVLIVEDHRLFADAIRPILEERGMKVIDVATTAARAMEILRSERPALVLVDIGLPDESGLKLGARILEELPGVQVVAITASEDPETVKEAVGLGFHGYLTKDMPKDKFVNSIRSILDGQVVVTGRLGKAAAGARTPEAEHAALLARQLTSREREVLELLAQGASSGDMTKELGVSPNTIRTHIQNILTKLQAHSRLEAAAFAVRHGLVKPRLERARA